MTEPIAADSSRHGRTSRWRRARSPSSHGWPGSWPASGSAGRELRAAWRLVHISTVDEWQGGRAYLHLVARRGEPPAEAGACTIRAAVMESNATSDHDAVIVPAGHLRPEHRRHGGR
jgi:hypothetical protein